MARTPYFIVSFVPFLLENPYQGNVSAVQKNNP